MLDVLRRFSAGILTLGLIASCVGGGTRQEPAPSLDAPAGTGLQMKGLELYSWQVGLDWRFSLLTGTNRNKSVSEIIDPKVTMSSLAELKERLAQLPPGEQVMWVNPTDGPFAYPPADVACELVRLSAERSVKLELGRPCEAA